ncbi:hypothetical protein BDZ90DRAFT_262592 [Jaminaea rosea]|uniref:S-adenosyl-L-methionine-dependent methyltransferase n=1 Tax=Jaminaea rosea TaxID=1569628 RepID=A0A316UJP2_9BASI|nr:hypothetical protein BDZ90DRAFT_262592 [Jaminaea rosea]PWN25144.1 hypothetical protein BDZ90DRAFT_262592 [Jaminaea rosea]
MARPSGPRLQEHDPNHPPDLAIKPSSVRANAAGSQWQTDSVETIREFGIAGRVWEAAYLFVKYLRPPEWLDGIDFDPPCPLFDPARRAPEPLTVLELGSGVGVVGLTCAQALHQNRRQGLVQAQENPGIEHDAVILTDLENVVDLMKRNAHSAGVPGVQVKALPWGSQRHARQILDELASSSSKGRKLDYVLCESPPPVLIAYKIRSMTKEMPFWTALGRWFDVEVVHCRRQRRAVRSGGDVEKQDPRASEEWHRFGSLRGDLDDGLDEEGDETSEDAYFVLIARRKACTQGWSAPPEDDQALMAGWMHRDEDRRRGDGGADWLEWSLMSAIGG